MKARISLYSQHKRIVIRTMADRLDEARIRYSLLTKGEGFDRNIHMQADLALRSLSVSLRSVYTQSGSFYYCTLFACKFYLVVH